MPSRWYVGMWDVGGLCWRPKGWKVKLEVKSLRIWNSFVAGTSSDLDTYVDCRRFNIMPYTVLWTLTGPLCSTWQYVWPQAHKVDSMTDAAIAIRQLGTFWSELRPRYSLRAQIHSLRNVSKDGWESGKAGSGNGMQMDKHIPCVVYGKPFLWRRSTWSSTQCERWSRFEDYLGLHQTQYESIHQGPHQQLHCRIC